MVLDPDFRILVWNRALTVQIGVRAEDVLGQRCFDCFPILEPTGGVRRIEGAFRGETTTVLEYFQVPASGLHGYKRVTRRPVYNADGQIVAALAVLEHWPVPMAICPSVALLAKTRDLLFRDGYRAVFAGAACHEVARAGHDLPTPSGPRPPTSPCPHTSSSLASV